MPNKRQRATARARRHDRFDLYTCMIKSNGLSLGVKPVNKIRMPRKLKKKIQKSFEALEALYLRLPMGNMQIEKAYLQKHGGLPLRTCHQKAFNDLMATGESIELVNIPRRMSLTELAMESEGNQSPPYLKDAIDAIKNLELTSTALKIGRTPALIMSTPTIYNMELDAARRAMRSGPHITIRPISEHVPVPQDIKEWAKGYRTESYDDFVKEGMKDICKRFNIQSVTEGREVSMKISGCHRVPAVSDGIRIIMKDEVDKDNE